MRSLESGADSFELGLTDRWADDQKVRGIRAGAACQLRLDGEPVVTGYIDDVLPEYDAATHSLRVSGRSKVGDLVDCSLAGESGQPRQWKRRNLLEIARELAGLFGIDVQALTDVGADFRAVSLEPGQSIFSFLEELARIRAVRLVSAADGSMLITRAGLGRSPTALVLGENILRASGEFSVRDRFSDYIVLGQQTGMTWDVDTATASAHLRGSAQDQALVTAPRYRPTVILAEGTVDTADCRRRAEWQRNTAAGRGQGVVYTVSGWTHASGLWQPNRVVPVVDSWLGVDADRLIVSVQFLLDAAGQRTELRVMPKEAFDLVPLPEPEVDEMGGLS